MVPVNDPRFEFSASPGLEELIAQQGKGPVADIGTLARWLAGRMSEWKISSRPYASGAANGTASQNDRSA